MIPFRSFRSFTGPVLFSRNPGPFPKRTGIGPVSDQYLLVRYRSIPVQYRSCIKRAVLDRFSKKRLVTGPYRTGENTGTRPVFCTGLIPVITGLIPVFFTGIGSVFFCALPYRSVTGPLPVRSVPIPLHCTVQQKPPQLTVNLCGCSGHRGLA